MALNYQLSGQKVEAILEVLAKQEVNESAAALIVSQWLVETVGKSHGTFSLKTAFPATEPDCAQQRTAREFNHVNWTDGVDVVQAGETPTEEGFNKRFHAIEGDLDGVIVDVAKLFECLGEMRGALRAILNEVIAEINRINAALNALTPSNSSFVPSAILPSLQNVPILVGEGTFGNQQMLAWQTQAGVVLLPKVNPPLLNELNPRLNSAGQMGRKILEDERMRQRFPNDVNVAELVAEFGNDPLADGRRVRDVVKILPDGFVAASLDELVNEVAEREAGAIRSQMGTTAAVKTLLGVDFEGESAATAAIDKATFIPSRATDALLQAGVTNFTDLTTANVSDLTTLMSERGVSVTAAEVAGWQGAARTLTRLR